MDYAIIDDLLEHPKVAETRTLIHHRVCKHDHLMRSAHLSYHLAPMLGADRRVCTRAALLHDIDSRNGTLSTHGAIAARYAAAIGETDQVCRAIVSHMYPLGPAPTSREGWVLVVADKIASLSDITCFIGGLFTGQSLSAYRQLCSSDPFYGERQRKKHQRKQATVLRRVITPSSLFWSLRKSFRRATPSPSRIFAQETSPPAP